MPENHPARAMQDTFYVEPRDGEMSRRVLRTHTSPVQIRTMQAQRPPIRIIAPGRVYRSDSDATHTPMFHQIEGLVIDRDIHLGHLKWTLETFLKAFFERDDVVLRMRPSYFPFTEPSAEVDVGWSMEKGRRVVGGSEGWMEVLGSGMVHPRVIADCGLDPDEWQGFAFGTGVDRLAMLKYGMDDLRAFFDARSALAQALRIPARSTCPTLSRRGWAHEVHPFVAEGASRHRRRRRPDRRQDDRASGSRSKASTNPAEALAPFKVARVLTAEQAPAGRQAAGADASMPATGRCRWCAARPTPAPGCSACSARPAPTSRAAALTLKVAAIRGVESQRHDVLGRASSSWATSMTGSSSLPPTRRSAPSFADYAGLDDPVFDVAVTPNRPDCMGVDGIARDLAAARLGHFKPQTDRAGRSRARSSAGRRSRSKPTRGCYVFWRRAIRGVSNGPSPEWLQQRLQGRRPAPDLGAGRHHQFLLDRPGAPAARL